MGSWDRRAIVLIHGIGVQAPRSTLRAFAEGLRRKAGGEVIEAEAMEPVPFGTAAPPAPAKIRCRGTTADVYEVYWAPHASHRTTARSVLAWILRLTFIPGSKIRRGRAKNYFDVAYLVFGVALAAVLVFGTLLALVNLTEFAKCFDEGLSPKDRAKCRVALEELEEDIPRTGFAQRSSFEGGLIDEPTSQLERLGDVGGVLLRASRRVPGQLGDRALEDLSISNAVEVLTAIPLVQLLVVALFVWIAAQVLYRIGQIAVTGDWRERFTAFGGLFVQLVLLFIAILAIPGPSFLFALPIVAIALVLRRVVAMEPRGTVGRGVVSLGASVNQSFVIVGLTFLVVLAQYAEPVYIAFAVLLAFAWFVVRGTSSFLSESLGDVQVYTTRNPNSQYFEARERILAQAERVFSVVAERDYREIVVLGHSLGAVVGFEAVESLRFRVPELASRIVAFVTIGSALEKVNYFFGQDPRTETSSVGSAQEEGLPGKTPAQRRLARAVENAEGRPWLNLWYWNDVVADRIFSFGAASDIASYAWRHARDRVPELLRESLGKTVVNIRFGSLAVWSHSRYWSDRRVLAVIAEAAFRPPTRSRSAAGRKDQRSRAKEPGSGTAGTRRRTP